MQIILRTDYRSSCWGTGGRYCRCVIIKTDWQKSISIICQLARSSSENGLHQWLLAYSTLFSCGLGIVELTAAAAAFNTPIERFRGKVQSSLALGGKFGFAEYFHVDECWCMADSYTTCRCLELTGDWMVEGLHDAWTDWQKAISIILCQALPQKMTSMIIAQPNFHAG